MRSCVDKRRFFSAIHQRNGRVVKGRYRVKIVTTTAKGAHATSVRYYRGCYKTRPKTVVTPRKKRRA